MRGGKMRMHAKRIGVVLMGLLLVLVWPSPRSLHAQSSPYVWRNVKIVAGGVISGNVASEQTPNLFYARTDIGGLYRWNVATRKWIPHTKESEHENERAIEYFHSCDRVSADGSGGCVRAAAWTDLR